MNRAGVVWPEMAKFADLSLVTNAQASSQPNPAVDGFRSFMTPDGTSVRNTWPLPRDAIKQIHSETNCEGCSKATVQQHSHSQRTEDSGSRCAWFTRQSSSIISSKTVKDAGIA